VFQYYRYGVRHPLISQRIKHVALVRDFGGGTFDVSVIETTVIGDISQSGRNSRPLAALSLPVGGFHFNRKIAEALLSDVVDKAIEKKKIRDAWKQFQSIHHADDASLDLAHPKLRNFIKNMKKTLSSVERGKVAICQSVSNWDLSADLRAAAAWRVPVPRDPFAESPHWIEVRLDAARLRSLFEGELWNQRLKSAIIGAIDRAHQELSGKRISIVLLSGGSANLRWLRQLMELDLRESLAAVEILELSENFQEIVAKGLAVECARRFHTAGSGDFRAVTYNRLCLVVRPDGGELEVRRFRPRFEAGTADALGDGVLLPSASILTGLIGQPLRWRVKLGHPPRRMLDYYFLRGSFDPEDIQSLHNVDTRVATPSRTSFGSSIEIELRVREDGTSIPAFVYGHGSQAMDEIRVEGEPFYLDMTFGSTRMPARRISGLTLVQATRHLAS
jgi:hypothetical protein